MKKGEHKGRKAPGDRGLYDYACIVDTYGNTLTVRSSSAACESCIWLFTKNREGKEFVEHLGQIEAVAPHLNLSGAKRLRDALTIFIDGCESLDG